MHLSRVRGALRLASVLLLTPLVAAPVADAAVSRSQAERRVIRALDLDEGKKPVVLFRGLTTVRPGTAIRQAGPSKTSAKSTAPADKVLKTAGIEVVKAAPIFTVKGEPAWFFYEDRAPFQAYEHLGRVVLVGQRTGRVQISKDLAWPPLLGTKLPPFLRNFAAYRDDRYRAFERAWSLGAGATNIAPAATRQARGNEKVVPPLPSTLGSDPASLDARREAARQLAEERSCAIRVSDSLGDFFDAGPVDSTRAALGRILHELSVANAGFYTAWYRTADGTPADLVTQAIEQKGCRDVLLYLAGGGTTKGSDPAVGVGLRARPGGKLERQLVTATAVRKILAAHPGVTFKIAVEAPRSGAFIAALSGAPNLLLAASSSRGNDGSFTALGEVVNEAGAPVDNAYNPNGYLEFTNRLITGLGCFLSRRDEVDAAVRAKAEGRTKSFFAWMLARAVGICGEGYLADQVEGAPAPPQLQLTFSQPTDADLNQTPVATDLVVSSDEDVPLTLTLPATDADKNSLSYAIVDAPAHGTLSGGPGAERTYTPAADWSGEDQFTFTATDGRATSAKRTVKITVRPVNDAPTVTLGTTPTTFTEGGVAVAVDPGVSIADIDDETATGATVAIGAGFDSGDVLAFSASGGITGSYDAGSGVLTLSGAASLADYRSVLRSVTFRNPSTALSSSTRQVVFRINDGKAFGASPDRPVSVAVVNDAPVLAGGGTSATFVEDAATGELVAPNVTVTDVDSPNLASATARITAGFDAAEDQLTFTAQPGITGAYDPATGVLSFAGAAAQADYQAALRSVRYRNGNTANPSTAARTVELQVDDGAAANDLSNTVTGTVDVTRVNDAPTITGSGATPTLTEGGADVTIDGGLLVGDVDTANLTSATVAIAAGFDASEDVLAASAALPAGLTGSYNAGTGVYAIVGSAPVASYQAALRLIVYRNTDGSNPSSASRTVRFVADDGQVDNPVSVPADVAVSVTPVNDAPVLAGGGNTVTFVEDGADVTVNGSITVSDVDSPVLSGATVQLTTAYVSTEDRLLFATQNGISGTFDTATGTLTLTGSASPANYQTALRSVQYRNANTANPSTTQRVVSFRVNDGAASSNLSNSVVSNADVSPTNDAPTAVAGGASPTFAEGGSPLVIDPSLAVGDVDSANLASATVAISTGFDSADDVLAFTDTATITGSYNAGTGVLTLTGTDSVADYQAALRTVTYRNTDLSDPSTATRTLQFRVNDGAAVSSPASTSVAVSAVNDLPVLIASGGSAAWVENATPTAAIAVDPGLALGDVDDANLTGATVAITGGFASAQDVLAFTDVGTITGSYNAGTGVLTLTGTATFAQYQSALRTVTYDNGSDTPNTANRTVTFTVADSSATPVTATRTIALTAANDAPRLVSGAGAPTWNEGGPAVVVDGAIQVSDPESDQITGAIVDVAGNWSPSDELLFTNQNGITGSYNAGSGRLTLTGTTSAANYQLALRSVEFRNTSGSPSTLQRGIDFRVSDASLNSNTVSTALTVVSNNTAPSLGGGGNTVGYTEDDAATLVNTAITALDTDDTDLESATVQIGAGYDATEDELTFTDTASITGSWSPVTGTLTLTGTDTVAAYQAALRAVRYVNNDHAAPSTVSRTIAFRVNDGEANSNAVTSTVTIALANDAPALTAGTGNVRTFTEGGSAVAVDDAITVADTDSANLTGATVSITAGFSSAQGDTLNFTNQSGITGSYTAGTGVLALSGTATVAQYQAALRSITFSNTSDAPTASRTVSFTASDGSATSAAVTHAVTIQGVNDAPVLAGGGTLAYTENDPATAIASGLTLTDLDSPSITGATVAVSAGYVNGQDVLSFANTPNITGSFSAATGVLTLSGTDTVAAYQAALRAVRYANSSESPSTVSRTVTYTATDNASTPLSGSTTATVDVTAVNDAPVAADVSHSGASTAIGNTALVVDDASDAAPSPAGPEKSITGDLLAGASDPDSSTLSITPATIATNDGGSLVIEADGDYTFHPAVGASCSDASDFADYTVSDGESTPQTDTGRITFALAGCVWYVQNNAAAGGNGTSRTPFDTLDEADVAATTTGAHLYVYRGDGTSTNLTDTVSLLGSQRLVGAAAALTVGGTTLESANAANRPSIAGTVELDDANVVEGLSIASSATPAIRGGAGDAAGTLDDLLLSGAGGGVELSSTSGTWDVSRLSAANTGGIAFFANAAGTVNLASTGTIALSNTAGPALTISGTTTSGVVDSATVSASTTTGIALSNNLGALTLDDVNVNATGTGLLVSSSENVTVNSSGDGVISSGGTAVDLNTDGVTPANPVDVALNSVTSTGGTRGIDIDDIGNGTFSAPNGALSGHTGTALFVSGGDNTVSYGGTIGNGTGGSATVQNRTGGTVTLSGSINDTNDTGGGVVLSGSSGGTTVLSGAVKTLNTATSNALEFSAAGAHALSITGGNLDIDTTSGVGIAATGANGSIGVTGATNTVTSTTGTAVSINGPDIAAADATFQSIASNGATSGIVLANTGTAGGLHVTGTGSAGTGGTIQNSSGPGIDLTNTREVQLASVIVTIGHDDGIRGSGVSGFQLTGASSITNNGNAVGERGVELTELSGDAGNPVALTNATVTGNAEDNVAIINDAATISSLSITGGSYANNSSSIGNDGIRLENTGTGDITNATISGATFTNNRGDHIQVLTDNSNSSAQSVTIQNNDLNGTGNQPGNSMLGGGIALAAGGSASQTIVVDNNDIERAAGSAISLNTSTLTAPTVRWTVTNNDIGTPGDFQSGSNTNVGIYGNVNGDGDVRALVNNNTIVQTAFTMIDIVANDGDADLDLTVQGNDLSEAGAALTFLYGVRLVFGSLETDEGNHCLDLGHSTNPALENQLFNTETDADPDIRIRQAGGPAGTLGLQGYAGGGVGPYLVARNDRGGTPIVSFSSLAGTQANDTCLLP